MKHGVIPKLLDMFFVANLQRQLQRSNIEFFKLLLEQRCPVGHLFDLIVFQCLFWTLALVETVLDC